MVRPYIQVSNTLTARTRRAIRSYRALILNDIAKYLDNVRLSAVKEIIPSKDPSNRGGFTRMYRGQPSTPGRLTERTGSLIRMLKDLTPWDKSPRGRKMSGDAMMGSVTTTTSSVIINEEFQGTLSAYIRSDSKYWPYNKGKARSRPTKQQLLMRFKWETGIRGEKRQFMEPAGRKNFVNTERLIQMKLDRLEQIGAINWA